MEPFDITPLWGPLIALLRSRKFLVAVITLIINVVIAYLPALEPVQAELLAVFMAMAAILIGGIAYEDAAAKSP